MTDEHFFVEVPSLAMMLVYILMSHGDVEVGAVVVAASGSEVFQAVVTVRAFELPGKPLPLVTTVR
jgi:hypothetical protein